MASALMQYGQKYLRKTIWQLEKIMLCHQILFHQDLIHVVNL